MALQSSASGTTFTRESGDPRLSVTSAGTIEFDGSKVFEHERSLAVTVKGAAGGEEGSVAVTLAVNLGATLRDDSTAVAFDAETEVLTFTPAWSGQAQKFAYRIVRPSTASLALKHSLPTVSAAGPASLHGAGTIDILLNTVLDEDVVVQLESVSTSITVPASVSIPAGQSRLSLPIVPVSYSVFSAERATLTLKDPSPNVVLGESSATIYLLPESFDEYRPVAYWPFAWDTTELIGHHGLGTGV